VFDRGEGLGSGERVFDRGEMGAFDHGEMGVIDRGKRGAIDRGERGAMDRGERSVIDQWYGEVLDSGTVLEERIDVGEVRLLDPVERPLDLVEVMDYVNRLHSNKSK